MADLVNQFVPEDLRQLYEVHSYRHAAEILATGCAPEFADLIAALRDFRLTKADIVSPGGNESAIPKRVSTLLRPRGWFETKIQGDLLVTLTIRREDAGKTQVVPIEKRIPAFLDGHKVDYVKGQVAFDLEWNSKDQTFDRDLYAFRAFYECGVVSVGVLLTRSIELNPVFEALGVMQKYGASTTWMGKLLPRLSANRNGGCPVLALGIKPALIEDLR